MHERHYEREGGLLHEEVIIKNEYSGTRRALRESEC